MMFHAENTLTAVALSVGFTMLPNSELHIRPGAMCCIVLLLYIGGGIAAQSALLHPALAFLINFWFLVLLLALISEPMEMKANISFLLCFVFSQSTYVPWTQFPARLACVSFGAPADLRLYRPELETKGHRQKRLYPERAVSAQ